MNQHYVPKVYLRNFGHKNKKSVAVNAYNKNEKKNFSVSINKICSEINLYTLPDNDQHYNDPLIIENGYAHYFEPMYSRVYKILIDDSKRIITDLERAEILMAIFQLYFRNPKLLIDINNFHEPIIRKLFKENLENKTESFTYLNQVFFVDKNLNEQLKTFKIETKNKFKKEHIYGFKELVLKNTLQSITIYKVIDNSKFVTCDNPLKNKNLNDNSQNPFDRLAQFFLPINEKYCLFLHNDKTKKHNIIYREEVFNGKTHLVNGEMIKNAHRFVIGNQKAIEDTLVFENIIETEYENNIDKFMTLIEELYFAIKSQGASEQHLNIFKKYISLYKKNGTLTSQEKESFIMEAMIQQKKEAFSKL